MTTSAAARSIDVASVLDRLCHRYPSSLVDTVTAFEPGRRLTAVKNVTVNEEFFQGHFPQMPVMPGVLTIESLTQVATMLLLHDGQQVRNARVSLRGVSHAKFRRQVVPGDRVTLDVELKQQRGPLARVAAVASVDGQVATEADLFLTVTAAAVSIHATATVHPAAVIGAGTTIGPNVTIGPHVRIGRDNRVGASCVIDDWTEIGDCNLFYPFGSFGLVPQDLKFGGEQTRLVIGNKNTFREFVTLHRGTRGGGGVTSIGDRNYFMAYSHVAHDCHVANDTIFANGATLAGHVEIDDFATIGAFSGIHQFCRVGKHAFIGGFSVATKDVLPFSKTVGNRARIYGVNSIGLVRRGLAADAIRKLKAAYRYLMISKLNTSRAVARIEQDPLLDCAEVRHLVAFIRSAKRGVVLKRANPRSGDASSDE